MTYVSSPYEFLPSNEGGHTSRYMTSMLLLHGQWSSGSITYMGIVGPFDPGCLLPLTGGRCPLTGLRFPSIMDGNLNSFRAPHGTFLYVFVLFVCVVLSNKVHQSISDAQLALGKSMVPMYVT